jgi:diguanylate cyclase (GGDEF)-like protein
MSDIHHSAPLEYEKAVQIRKDPIPHDIVVALASDAAIQAAMQEHLERASYDELTGLRRPARFEADAERLRARTQHSQYEGGDLAVVMIDLNDLKPVNDQEGHQAGDILIRAVAKAIEQQTRPNDITGRLGGDEFGVVLNIGGKKSDRWLQILGGDLKERIEADVQENANHSDKTISLGIAFWEPEVSLYDVLALADRYMYDDKRFFKGRN